MGWHIMFLGCVPCHRGSGNMAGKSATEPKTHPDQCHGPIMTNPDVSRAFYINNGINSGCTPAAFGITVSRNPAGCRLHVWRDLRDLTADCELREGYRSTLFTVCVSSPSGAIKTGKMPSHCQSHTLHQDVALISTLFTSFQSGT